MRLLLCPAYRSLPSRTKEGHDHGTDKKACRAAAYAACAFAGSSGLGGERRGERDDGVRHGARVSVLHRLQYIGRCDGRRQLFHRRGRLPGDPARRQADGPKQRRHPAAHPERTDADDGQPLQAPPPPDDGGERRAHRAGTLSREPVSGRRGIHRQRRQRADCRACVHGGLHARRAPLRDGQLLPAGGAQGAGGRGAHLCAQEDERAGGHLRRGGYHERSGVQRHTLGQRALRAGRAGDERHRRHGERRIHGQLLHRLQRRPDGVRRQRLGQRLVQLPDDQGRPV